MESLRIPIDLHSGKRTISEKEPPRPTDSLDDLRIKLESLGTFIAEGILAFHHFRGTDVSQGVMRPQLLRVALKDWPNRVEVPVPAISVDHDAMSTTILDSVTDSLYHTALTGLISVYEDYLGGIAWEVYQGNADHLLARPERQLTSEDLFQLGTFRAIRNALRDRAVENLLNSRPYPQLVERFAREFHVGIHHRKSPMDQFTVHHIIELRNVAVHNHGRTNEQYRARLSEYGFSEVLAKDTKIPVDFIQFFRWLFLFEELCTYIDEEVKARWICSAWRRGDPDPPDLQYSSSDS